MTLVVKYKSLRISFLIIVGCILATYSSKGQGLVNVHARSNLQINAKAEIKTNKAGKSVITYTVFRNGFVDRNQMIEWSALYLSKDSKNNVSNKRYKVRFELPAGNSSNQLSYSIDGFAIEKIIENDAVITNIDIPGIDEFDLKMSSNYDFVMAGEIVSLEVNTNRTFRNISWNWRESRNGPIKHTGAHYQPKLSTDKTFYVQGQYGNVFKTAYKEIRIDVKDPNELVDFKILGPVLAVNDTSKINFEIQVSKNAIPNLLKWNWFRSSDGYSKAVSEGAKYTLTPQPIVTDTLIKVCAEAEGRVISCSYYRIPLHRLPAPGKFSVTVPPQLYSDQSAILNINQVGTDKNTVWTWIIDGRRVITKEKNITIKNPVPGMQICVYPELNKRGGEILKQCLNLNNVVVKTILPNNIIGNKSRCRGDLVKQVYRLNGAVLGSTSKFWNLYDENKLVRSFKSDTILLAPEVTTKYRISAENQPGQFYEFTIEVTSPPDSPVSVTGPEIVCSGESFTLQIPGAKPPLVQWNWYKKDRKTGLRKFIGEGATITDQIQSDAIYEIEAELNGCISKNKISKLVNIYTLPNQLIRISEILSANGGRVDLKVSNPEQFGIKYQWSDDEFGTVLREGPELDGYFLKKGFNKISVRAINNCGAVSASSIYTTVRKQNGFAFFNVGLSSNDFKSPDNFLLTLGIKSFYLRAKFNPIYLYEPDKYSTTFSSTKLEISNAGRVVNFPNSTGSYYTVNGEKYSFRQGVSMGTMIGNSKTRAYIGGGYGERVMLWGLSTFQYSGGVGSQYWSKNIDQSYKGIEAELGVFLKMQNFNIMAGGNVIIDPLIKSPYIEVHLGFGLSNR